MTDTETALKEGSEEMILDMVREQLQRTNPPSTEALYGRAARIDPAIRELTLRQFNARYPLRARREMARNDQEASDREEPRHAVRKLLFDFARTVVVTPKGSEFVDLVSNGVDEWTERIVDALGQNTDR